MNTMKSLYAAAPVEEIIADWTNFDGTPTVYITQNPSLNIVSMSFENQLRNTVVLPPGTPTRNGSLPAGQSAIYLSFGSVLSSAEIKAIKVGPASAGAWTAACFPDSQGFTQMVLAPLAQVQIAVGQKLEIQLINILSSASDFSDTATMEVQGAVGIPIGLGVGQVFINVGTPPIAGNKPLDLLVGFAGTNLVFTGSQQNDLTLFLTNPNPSQTLVPGGTATWGQSPPTFRLSLVYGDDPGALATLQDAGNISVNNSEMFGNHWDAATKQLQGNVPYYTLQPDKTDGGNVLGTGQNASVSFRISNIISSLPQGLTYAYLSYRDIPGYDDGFFALEIVKVDPIIIKSFTATPQTLNGVATPTKVLLAFEVLNASYVTVTNTSYAKATTGGDLSDTVSVMVSGSTTYTLIANNFATGQIVALALPVDATNPDLVAQSFAAGAATIAGRLTSQELHVNTNLSVGGTVTAYIGDISTNLQIGGMLTTRDATVTAGLQANTLTVQNATIAANLNAGGALSAHDVNVTSGHFNQTLRIEGGAGITALSIGGNGSLSVDAPNIPAGRFVVQDSGNVGIGTSSPLAPLHVQRVQGSVSGAGTIRDQFVVEHSYQWNDHSSNQMNNPYLTDRGSNAYGNTSILANGAIVGSVFYCFSDERLKIAKGRSDGDHDLQTLLGIEVTDYRYKDRVGSGAGTHKKLMAQQVREVYPQAVSTQSGVVPDIMSPASSSGDWIYMETDLQRGERVRLLCGDRDDVYEVMEATAHAFRTTLKTESKDVFVYGREVKDFCALDYNAIAMLNVSATQQIKKDMDMAVSGLKAENEELRRMLAETLEELKEEIAARRR